VFSVDQCVGERYRLMSRIASGGMGEVWRAHDDRLQRDVAVKLLRPEHADDEAFRARLKAEARSAGALNCNSVVDVYDWGEQVDDAGRWVSYIVMELVDGQTVASVIGRDGGLGPLRTASVVADAATGLAAAHQVGLVHRDVKPANLLMTTVGRIKVADFGIARAKDGAALTATGTLVGTAEYLSPEQVRGRAATSASDVYSLGVVAYQCVTGAPPFRGDGDIATAVARLDAPIPSLPPTVPSPLVDLIVAMLDPEPGLRPTARDVAAVAARVAAEPVTAALPASGHAPTLVLPIGDATALTTSGPIPFGARMLAIRRPGLVAAGVALLLAGILVPVLLLSGSPGNGAGASQPTVSPTHAGQPSRGATVDQPIKHAPPSKPAPHGADAAVKPKAGGPAHRHGGKPPGHGHGPNAPHGHNKH
jgi:eukaryotic-like serine/threonine-protein kinase